MIIHIDQSLEEPLYMQIRTQLIAAIAREELLPGDPLPSVRSLAQDLGINLHTVNKSYAVLRDEGYLVMKGRSGASVADPRKESAVEKVETEHLKMNEELQALALAYRARGGSMETFLEAAKNAALAAYEGERA